MQLTTMKVKITTLEEILGMSNANPKIHDEFIASNAPDAPSREEEISALGVEAVQEKGKTIFPRNAEGRPILWDYQIKGFFKDTCGMLRVVPKTKSSTLKSYKKRIDGNFFVQERQIPIEFDGEIGECQRPLRAQTMQGERVALASSESIPAGATLTFTVLTLIESDMDFVREWLDYGVLRGFGQWRNSGKGRFTWEEIAS
jgi:hypothetical protein